LIQEEGSRQGALYEKDKLRNHSPNSLWERVQHSSRVICNRKKEISREYLRLTVARPKSEPQLSIAHQIRVGRTF